MAIVWISQAITLYFLFYYERNSFLFQRVLPSIKRTHRSCIIPFPREKNFYYLVRNLTDFSPRNIYHVIVNFQRKACSFSPKGLCSHFLASWILPPHSLASPVSLSSLVASRTINVLRTFTKGRRETTIFPVFFPSIFSHSTSSSFPPFVFKLWENTKHEIYHLYIFFPLSLFSQAFIREKKSFLSIFTPLLPV